MLGKNVTFIMAGIVTALLLFVLISIPFSQGKLVFTEEGVTMEIELFLMIVIALAVSVVLLLIEQVSNLLKVEKKEELVR